MKTTYLTIVSAIFITLLIVNTTLFASASNGQSGLTEQQINNLEIKREQLIITNGDGVARKHTSSTQQANKRMRKVQQLDNTAGQMNKRTLQRQSDSENSVLENIEQDVTPPTN
jgi:hypothetical protein